MDLQFHSVLILAVNRDEWSALRRTLYPTKTTHLSIEIRDSPGCWTSLVNSEKREISYRYWVWTPTWSSP